MTSSRLIHRKLHRIGQKTERATPIIASMQLHPTLHCPVSQAPAPPQQYRKKGLLNPRGYVRRAEITTSTEKKIKKVNYICPCAFFFFKYFCFRQNTCTRNNCSRNIISSHFIDQFKKTVKLKPKHTKLIKIYVLKLVGCTIQFKIDIFDEENTINA